jgi:hypothetical protein
MSSKIGSVVIFLLEDDTGSVAEPSLSGISDRAALLTAYPDGVTITPESSLKISGDEIETLGQADDGTVFKAETLTVHPGLSIEADIKSITDKAMELFLGADGKIKPGINRKGWALIALVSHDEPMTISASEITAFQLIKGYVNYGVKGEPAMNGKDEMALKYTVSLDLSKPATYAKTLSTT